MMQVRMILKKLYILTEFNLIDPINKWQLIGSVL